MAEFNAGSVVFVPMPANPEVVVWALPGPTGDVPYEAVEILVSDEFNDRIQTMTALEQSSSQSAAVATTAAGVASTAAAESTTAKTVAEAAAATATTKAGQATTAASDAVAAAGIAEQYALEFDIDVTASTGVPGAPANAVVTGAGPSYQIELTIPKGDKGDPGEITQAQLDAAVATVVGSAPEALNALDELATALGNDPNFATTVSAQIGERAKTVDVATALDLKADKTDPRFTNARTPTAHTHVKAEVGLGNVDNTSDANKPVSTAQRAAIDAKIQLVTSFPASPTAGVLYLKAE